VKLQVNWATTEPRESSLDLARFDDLIAESARHDMDVYLGFVIEHAPHWLWRKHPGCRMVGRDGTPVAYEAVATLPADGKPGPCFDHPGARADMLSYLDRAVRHLGRHRNISIWSTWQEVGYWAEGDWLIGQSVCFCPNTLAAFRGWLRDRHAGDLDALNRAWRTNHGDWADILPTRSKRGKDTHAVDLAWHDFMHNEQVARVLECRAAAVRAADPRHRPVFAHKGSALIGAGQDRRYGDCQDFLGFSAYPAWFPFAGWDDGGSARRGRIQRREALVAEAWQSMALTADHMRAASPGGRTWAAELQGGPVSPVLHKGRVPDGADLRRWILTGLAHGISGVCFWVARSEVAAAELDGFSLLDSEGDGTERFAEAGRLARAVQQHAELFADPSTPPAPLALVVDDANWRFHQSLIHAPEHLGYSVRGWHRLAFDLGLPMDFLHLADFDARAGQHRCLILPFPLLLEDATTTRLAAWVEAGGTLISECCPGRVDGNAFATRGEISAAARELFGTAQESFQLIREPGDEQRWTFAERTWGEFQEAQWLQGVGDLAGQRLRPSFCLTTFRPTTAAPLLTLDDGRIAGTVRRLGKGRAILIGSVLGHAGTAHRDAAHHAGIAALTGLSGVKPQTMGGCTLMKRIAGNCEAWFLFNPGEQTVTVDLDVTGFTQVEDLLGCTCQRLGHRLSVTVEGLDLRCLILRRDTRLHPEPPSSTAMSVI
jgi:beta-galactosidase GanA